MSLYVSRTVTIIQFDQLNKVSTSDFLLLPISDLVFQLSVVSVRHCRAVHLASTASAQQLITHSFQVTTCDASVDHGTHTFFFHHQKMNTQTCARICLQASAYFKQRDCRHSACSCRLLQYQDRLALLGLQPNQEAQL